MSQLAVLMGTESKPKRFKRLKSSSLQTSKGPQDQQSQKPKRPDLMSAFKEFDEFFQTNMLNTAETSKRATQQIPKPSKSLFMVTAVGRNLNRDLGSQTQQANFDLGRLLQTPQNNGQQTLTNILMQSIKKSKFKPVIRSQAKPLRQIMREEDPIENVDTESNSTVKEERKKAEEAKIKFQREEEEFHNLYLQKYHRFQKKIKNIEQEGSIEKHKLQNVVNERAGINNVLREQMEIKEQARKKLEMELKQMQDLVNDNEEKLIKLKQANAIYLDNFARDKINDKLNADLRQQELNNRQEKEKGAQIIGEIKHYLTKQKKTNDKLLQAGLYRKEMQKQLNKMLDYKVMSQNQMGEIEREWLGDMKQLLLKGDKLFEGVPSYK